jgi:hypothetical protein
VASIILSVANWQDALLAPMLEDMTRKTALRTITVDGVSYRWKADWVYIAGQVRTVRLRIWGGDKTRQALHAHLVGTFHGFRTAVAAGRIPKGSPVVDTTYVEPREVRAVIVHALGRGWSPQSSGQPFCLGAADPGPSADLAFVDIT